MHPTGSNPNLLMESDRLELLQAMPVFGGTSRKTLSFLIEQALIHVIEKGEYFFHQDDVASSMFVLESGAVAVIKKHDGKELLVRELGKGDCFGEMALLDLYPRSSSVMATEQCRAIEIRQETLFGLYQEDLEQFTIIQMNIGREISRRLRLTDEQLFKSA